MPADFEFDVGLNLEEIRGDFEVVDESIRQLGTATESVVNSFLKLEKESQTLGVSLQTLTGINKEAEGTYLDFIDTLGVTGNTFSSFLINQFSPVVAELDEYSRRTKAAKNDTESLASAVSQMAKTAFREFAAAAAQAIGFRDEIVEGLRPDPGSRFLRITEDDLTVRAARERAQVAERLQGSFPFLISRRTLLREQAAELEGLEPLSVLRERQSRSLRRFDIRQQGALELRQLQREESADKIIESNRTLRESIDNLARQLGLSQSEAIGVLRTGDI